MSSSAAWIKAERSSQRQRDIRRIVLADGPVCVHCRRRSASILDHQPPLALFSSFVEWLGAGGIYVPSCRPCSQQQAGEVCRQVALARKAPRPTRRW